MLPASAADEDAASGTSAHAAERRMLGRAFAEALGRKDFDAVLALLDPAIDFRGLTPSRAWEASGAEAVVEGVLRQWFEETDTLEEVVSIETDSLADRERVAYRFRGRNEDGPFVVEQQAYYTQRDERIDWMRVLCSGFRGSAASDSI